MLSKLQHSVVLLLLGCLMLSIGCAAQACKSPEGWIQLDAENSAKTLLPLNSVSIDLDRENIPMGEPFSFTLQLCQSGNTAIQRITATAIMPAHLHGMNYSPEVKKITSQPVQYWVEGFLFHMPGVWKITVSITVSYATKYYSTEVTVK